MTGPGTALRCVRVQCLRGGRSAGLGRAAAPGLRHRVSGTVRSAGLRPPRIRDYLPRRPAALLSAQLVILVVLLAGAAATGSAADLGRAGRSFTVICEGFTSSRGPWPVAGLVRRCAHADRPGDRHRAVWLGPAPDRRQDLGRPSAAGPFPGDRLGRGLLVTVPLTGVALTVSSCLRGTECLGTAPHTLGWALLPVTALAADLGLANGTVSRAYRELESAGLVHSRSAARTPGQ